MDRVVTSANSQRKYGVGEARLLMGFVNYASCFSSDSPLFEIRDDGVFLSEIYKDVLWSSRAAKGIDELFYWNPAWELEDGPSPLTTPLLPVPFTARDLAAVLVSDIGVLLREQFGEIGQLDDDRLESFGARDAAHARRALREAYELAAHALTSVGPLEISEVVSDEAEQRRADWRGAMVRELFEGSDTHQEVELVAAEQDEIRPAAPKQAAPAEHHKPRGRKPSDAPALLKQILDALDNYAAAAGQDFDRNAMPGPLGESFDDEGSFHWLCASLYPYFKKAKPTFQKHRAGLCALAPYAKPTDFYRLALPHIAPKLGSKLNVHHTPKQGRKAA